MYQPINFKCLIYIASRFGRLPDTIFYQMDGGSENANKYFLAILELLVIKRLTKRFYATRLNVGHTHEDIDSKFARIWLHCREDPVLTPQEYNSMLRECFKNSRVPVEVKPFFIVPDYQSLMEDCIDPSFGGWAKEELTQLAWRFQGVKRTKEFPFGVRTDYRAFANDTTWEIIEDKSGASILGYKAVRTHSRWEPYPSAHNVVGGLYLLKKLPDGAIDPQVVSFFLFNIYKSLRLLKLSCLSFLRMVRRGTLIAQSRHLKNSFRKVFKMRPISGRLFKNTPPKRIMCGTTSISKVATSTYRFLIVCSGRMYGGLMERKTFLQAMARIG